MFSKKKPQDAPEIPDYDTFVLRYNKDKENTSDQTEEFRTDAWWLDKKIRTYRPAEVKAGGEKALNHQLPDAMNIEPDIDEETESMMRDFFYGAGELEETE